MEVRLCVEKVDEVKFCLFIALIILDQVHPFVSVDPQSGIRECQGEVAISSVYQTAEMIIVEMAGKNIGKVVFSQIMLCQAFNERRSEDRRAGKQIRQMWWTSQQ